MPLEHAAPGTPGFEKNIREMVASGHPQKQAVAAAYAASRDDAQDPLLAAADALFAHCDSFERGEVRDAQITSGNYSKVRKGDKITQEWDGKQWKTVDPKSSVKGPRETQTWSGTRWDSEKIMPDEAILGKK